MTQDIFQLTEVFDRDSLIRIPFDLIELSGPLSASDVLAELIFKFLFGIVVEYVEIDLFRVEVD